MLNDPNIVITIEPKGADKISEFLTKVGRVKVKPDNWQDYYFGDVDKLKDWSRLSRSRRTRSTPTLILRSARRARLEGSPHARWLIHLAFRRALGQRWQCAEISTDQRFLLCP